MPKVFFGPGPKSTTVLSLLSEFEEIKNSVPLTPNDPLGIFISKLSGFFSLIFPEIVFTLLINLDLSKQKRVVYFHKLLVLNSAI